MYVDATIHRSRLCAAFSAEAAGEARGVPDRLPPLILTSAVVSLLIDSLDQPETRGLVNTRFSADLRGLQARLEVELAAVASRKHMRLADRRAVPSMATDD